MPVKVWVCRYVGVCVLQMVCMSMKRMDGMVRVYQTDREGNQLIRSRSDDDEYVVEVVVVVGSSR